MTTTWLADHPAARRLTQGALLYGIISIVCGGARSDTEFLRYDAAERLVHLTITARYNGANGGFNFNGGSRGRHRITVPVGWRVQIAFTNADVISHSVAVVREAKQVPIRIEKPAFVGAASRGVETGIPAGTRQDDIVFVADRAGEYLLACGVPGHAAVGSYLRFTVSTDAAVPTYEIGAVAKRSVPQY